MTRRTGSVVSFFTVSMMSRDSTGFCPVSTTMTPSSVMMMPLLESKPLPVWTYTPSASFRTRGPKSWAALEPASTIEAVIAKSAATSPVRFITGFLASKIGFAGFRGAVIEQDVVVLGARVLDQRLLLAGIALPRLPGPIESLRVVHADHHFQGVAVFDEPPALGDMQLAGMRRAISVDESLGVLPNGIDDERIAFIVPDRISVPGWFRI